DKNTTQVQSKTTDSANNCDTVLEGKTAETIEKTVENTAEEIAKTTETATENTTEITAENKRGKGRLQTKTAVKTAFSFYKIKSTRNILTILAILLVSILLFTTINLSCLNYEKMVINSVKKSDSNGIILSHRGTNSNYFKAQASTPFGNHLVASSYNSDLSAVKGEIEKELNIESANVYNLLISFNKRLNHYANYKNGEVISRMDNIYLGMEMERALLCDDIQKIGIKLINGREPKGVNECLIPKFFMDILLKMKFSIVNYEEETEVPEFEILEFNNEQDVYNHSFGSYKVVGVFEDNFVADKKIAGLDFNGKLDGKILSEDKREKIADKISMNIRNYPLLNTIIMSENNLENFTNINNISIGNNQEASEQYRFSATEGTCFVFSVDTENLLANGKICLGEQEKKNLKDTAGNPVEVGSKIKLKLNHIVGGAIVGFENIEFVIAKFEGYKNIISAGDYKKLFGGYVLPPQAIYFNKENLKPTDLKRISKIVENNFAKTDDDSIRYEYLGNNTISLHNDYSTFAFIKNFVIIPFTIVLALLLGFMMSLFVINIVNKNAEEIVILRVLGANNRQIFKIFAVFLPIILLAEFVTAVALGSAIVYSMQGYLAISEYSTMFYVAGVAVALLGAIMVVVNIIALMSTFLLRCKNIRQSFQKIEEA
ncbi:MAG: ABC transporter permease, partial [Clostridia bacterium]